MEQQFCVFVLSPSLFVAKENKFDYVVSKPHAAQSADSLKHFYNNNRQTSSQSKFTFQKENLCVSNSFVAKDKHVELTNH